MADITQTLTFRLRQEGGPIESFQADQLSEEHCKMFELVGRIVVLWTRIERDVSFIYGKFHRPDIEALEIPKQFRRRARGLSAKLEYIDYLMAEVTQMNPLEGKWKTLRGHIVSMSEIRGKLVHWANIGFETVDGELMMKFCDSERLPREFYTEAFSLSDLTMAAQKIGNVGLYTMFFQSELMHAVFGPIRLGQNKTSKPDNTASAE